MDDITAGKILATLESIDKKIEATNKSVKETNDKVGVMNEEFIKSQTEINSKLLEQEKQISVLYSKHETCLLRDHKNTEALYFVSAEKKTLEKIVDKFVSEQELKTSKEKEKVVGIVKIWYVPVTVILTGIVTWILTWVLSHIKL